MRGTLSISTFSILFCLLLSASTNAEPLICDLKMGMSDSTARYEREKSSDEFYTQTSFNLEVNMTRSMYSKNRGTKDDTLSHRVTYCPGKDDSNIGFSKLEVAENAGKYFLKFNSKIVILKTNEPHKAFPNSETNFENLSEEIDYRTITQSASYEMKFIEGNWKIFQKGDRVKLQLTDESAKIFLEHTQMQVAAEVRQSLMSYIEKDSAEKLDGSIQSEFKEMKTVEIVGDKNRMDIQFPDIEITIQAKIK